MNNKLSYKNEDDRAYGLSGMALALASMDALDRVAEISLDSDGPMVAFSNDFFYMGVQAASPKAVRQKLMENFQLTSVLAVSNVLARCLVRDRLPKADQMLAPIKKAISDEGRDELGLDDDEIDRLYAGVLAYSRRIFENRRIHPLIKEFAELLRSRRSLSGREIAEMLSQGRFL